MEALVIILIVIWAVKHSAGEGHLNWQSSKAANRRRTRGRSVPRRAASAVQHDFGYWLHQVLNGFPQARHGLADGWHAGRAAQVQGAAERQKARADHLSLRARLIPEIREHRRRQAEAIEQIRAARHPEPPAPDDDPGPAPQDGPTYSYGYEGSQSHWPAESATEAYDRARLASRDGDPWQVAQYPPGGGPGRTVATYRNGLPVSQAEPGHALSDITSLTPIRCMVHGTSCTWAEYADGTGEHRTPREEDDDPDLEMALFLSDLDVARERANPPTEGPDPMNQATSGGTPFGGSPFGAGATNRIGAGSGDTTYTQQLREFTAIRDDAEAQVNDARIKRMMNHLDILTSLGLDKDSLSEAASIDDALRQQQKAAQETLDAADAAIHGLKTRHGGIKQAVDDAPVDQPAQPEFYAD
jgi:hypothetical protein